MRRSCLAFLLPLLAFPALLAEAQARTVVFSEPGFPTVSSEPVSPSTLASALGPETVFAGAAALPAALPGAGLLVLPYGSAFPAADWPAIDAWLKAGGNLLILGGQPFHVPVTGHPGTWTEQNSQETWSRTLDFRNTYALPPIPADATFAWRDGYTFLPRLQLHARRFFAVEGRLNGLGYMVDSSGDRVAAPVIVADRGPARIIALDFDPQPGYWSSPDGLTLIRAAAIYAAAGPARFWIETRYAALRPGESPQLALHLRLPHPVPAGQAHVELLAGEDPSGAASRILASATIPLAGAQAGAPIPFDHPLPAGFYTVRATWSSGGRPRESCANGFRVEDLASLATGPALGVHGDFLTRGGRPWLPVGTNYFSTESNGWDFSGPRNALVWERDFADMERHGVTLVRTGVWMPNAKFVDPATGQVSERFLRNVEGFLAAAQDHHIAVNFTFYAFVPKVGEQPHPTGAGSSAGSGAPPPNPYLNPAMVQAEHQYVLSVVHRFAHVPWLSYDLINEPSFSNPRLIFHGNVPNGDPDELAAWRRWLREKYVRIEALAAAWSVPPSHLGSFDAIPLPAEADLNFSRYGNPGEVRALDYNLFAQAMFSGWVHGMVEAIRSAGSTQLIDVGQDEGGVTDRLLNRFYAGGGVSFTTNHTYWQDDALLWDSVAAKVPGIPSITGETGYQPVWSPDGTWRYDELTGLGLEERKWALGFAAGVSGALQWDWDREVDFGIERSDGSAKLWENMLRDLGRFAEQAAPWATALEEPQVAIILPQSLQLSVLKQQAIEAQQTAVRVLFNYDHTAAYAVGEYQIGALGSPRLIILPSSYALTDASWRAIEKHVRDGATLLISGPFAADPHLHPTDRAARIGLAYLTVPLELRDQTFTGPGIGPDQPLPLVYGGQKTTLLSRAQLPGGQDWIEQPLGKGKILFSALPLELNDRLDSVAAVYAWAIRSAGVTPTYTTDVTDPGILICPTLLPKATLYVLTSETNQTAISFRDQRSGRTVSGTLEPGRAALLLIGMDGKLIASYHWHGA